MVTNVTLKQTEKNDVFAWVKNSGLDPDEFQWLERKLTEGLMYGMGSVDSKVSVLTHIVSEYFFVFGAVRVHFSPGVKGREDREEHGDKWDTKRTFFRAWLNELLKEINAPNLWASLGEEKALTIAASSPNLNNSPFTPNEQSLIITRLDEVKRYLIDGQQFDAEQAVFIEQEFAYLREAATRQGRKDWLNLLLSGLVSLIVGLVLEPERARGLLALAGTVFQSLWGVAQAYLQ
jgi:hypothetical protein